MASGVLDNLLDEPPALVDLGGLQRVAHLFEP